MSEGNCPKCHTGWIVVADGYYHVDFKGSKCELCGLLFFTGIATIIPMTRLDRDETRGRPRGRASMATYKAAKEARWTRTRPKNVESANLWSDIKASVLGASRRTEKNLPT